MQRVLVGAAVALCVAVCVATYTGTRSALDTAFRHDAAQVESLERIERHLAALDETTRDLRRRIRDLETERTAPNAPTAVTAGAPSEPEVAEVTQDLRALPALFLAPGAIIVDPAQLQPEEQEYLEAYPPSENAVLVRGRAGRLGLLRVSAIDETGQRSFERLAPENSGLLEELSTAIVDLEAAREEVVAELIDRGVGRSFASAQEAFQHGQELGSYMMLPREDGFGVVPADRVETDPRVAAVGSWVEAIKQDFGEYTSYAVSWVDPAARGN